MSQFTKIRVILVEPTHPGNIGAVARSMLTMGLSELVLVKPKKFPHAEATKRAVSAETVLESARVVDDLSEALQDCTLILGTSVRDREVSWPTLAPHQAALDTVEHLSADHQHQVAIVFGRESSGLSNQELERCQLQVRIPANDEYSSLNLASAVQIICYEMRIAVLQQQNLQPEEAVMTPVKQRQQLANQQLQEGHLEHLLQVLVELDFFKKKPPAMLMRKLTRLYNKSQLTVEEIQILRGILAAIQSQNPRS